MRWFLRRLFPPRVPKPQTKYIGVVHGYSVISNEDGSEGMNYDGWWILSHTGGERKAKKVGDPRNSALAIEAQADVEAWLAGGPVPRLGSRRINATPPPKPRKSKPIAKKQDNVVAFAKKAG